MSDDFYDPWMPDLSYKVDQIGDNRFLVYFEDYMDDYIAVFFASKDAEYFAAKLNRLQRAEVDMIHDLSFEKYQRLNRPAYRITSF